MAYVTERQSALPDAKPEPEMGSYTPHRRLMGGRPTTPWVYPQQLDVMPIMQCNGIWRLASLCGSAKISKSQQPKKNFEKKNFAPNQTFGTVP